MKKSYETRAKKFIRDFFPYLAKELDHAVHPLAGTMRAVTDFNLAHHRNVEVRNGATRIVFVTSDYVVKMEYDEEEIKTWGGNQLEADHYENAKRDGFEYLFAKPTLYEYAGIEWLIMPKATNIGNSRIWSKLDDIEQDWIWSNIGDTHEGNYGTIKGNFVLIDYACSPW